MLPEGAAPDKPQHDPSLLAPALAPYKGRKVTVGYYTSLSQNRELASRLQTQLQSLGLKATLREYPPSILFNLPGEPNQRPDILATGFNPDSVAPDTFARIYWYKDAPVNLLGCTAPEGDRLLDEAAHATTPEAGMKANVAAAEAYRKSNCWLNTADANDIYVARKGLTGFKKGAGLDPRRKARGTQRGLTSVSRTSVAPSPSDATAPSAPLVVTARDLHVDLSRNQDTYHVLRGVDLDIAQGEVLGLVGESGSGKSVLGLTFLGPAAARGAAAGHRGPLGRRRGHPCRS